jgi:hypothetical protein
VFNLVFIVKTHSLDNMAEVDRDESPARQKVVHVVTMGEDYEGGKIFGIFNTLASARKHALEFIAKHRRSEKWRDVGTNSWKNGCDNLEIEEWPVQE